MYTQYGLKLACYYAGRILKFFMQKGEDSYPNCGILHPVDCTKLLVSCSLGPLFSPVFRFRKSEMNPICMAGGYSVLLLLGVGEMYKLIQKLDSET